MTRYITLIALLATACATRAPQPEFAEFAHATPQKDTLYLLAGDSHSQALKALWDMDSVTPKPHIAFVDCDQMGSIKKRLSYDKKN